MLAGDRVVFKDEKLSGYIKNILPNGIVKVETDDGFIIDALESQLVVSKPFFASTPIENSATQEQLNSKADDLNFDLNNNQISFYAVPFEENKILTGLVSYFLVNATQWPLYYVFGSKIGKTYQLRCSGKLEPFSPVQLSVFSREDITVVSNYVLQIIMASEDSVLHPISKEFAPMIPDLNHHQKNSQGRMAFSKKQMILDLSPTEIPDLEILKEKFKTDAHTKPVSKKTVPDTKGKTNKQTALLYNSKVVDLHIEQLTDNYQEMTNTQMLELQKSVVIKEMENALINHYKKITFIHGIGNGVLRNAVKNELLFYPDIQIKDADYSQFGGGAIDVWL